MRIQLALLYLLFFLSSCVSPQDNHNAYPIGSYGYDVKLLQSKHQVDILSRRSGEVQVAVVGAYQGRVMTSTATGWQGKSLGWLNHDLIQTDTFVPHIHAYGGEDRIWLGPEGGQFGLFFLPGKDFTFENWQTPGAIDTANYPLVVKDSSHLIYEKSFSLQNYSGQSFQVMVKRRIDLLDEEQIGANLGVAVSPKIHSVAFQSTNDLTNTGLQDWTKDNGLLSIWILGMFPPSPHTTIIVPIRQLSDSDVSVRDSYFGKVPPERLLIRDSTVFFRGDGGFRSKIGIPPALAKPLMGSYDSESQVLTLVQFSLGNETSYVNSLWEIQKEPYGGDVVNSYNDGPLEENGAQLGPFYELESSSPAPELKVGESLEHVHRTYHFQGDPDQLTQITEACLGLSIAEIQAIFP